MTDMNYGATILKTVVAQMCKTVGWNSINTTSLELLTDLLQKYILEVAEDSHRYAEQFGHTQPNLHDLGLAFQDMSISVTELEEYVEYFAKITPQIEVPKYPVERKSHLNWLRPGSQEVITRPLHIHDHLPAMYPQLEDGVDRGKSSARVLCPESQSKLVRQAVEEVEGSPLRQLTSVLMTRKGFLSSTYDGKLPVAHTPTASYDFITSHSLTSSSQNSFFSSSHMNVPPKVKSKKKHKKKSLKKNPRKMDNAFNTKDQVSGYILNGDNSKVENLVSMEEHTKLKTPKTRSPFNHRESNGQMKIFGKDLSMTTNLNEKCSTNSPKSSANDLSLAPQQQIHIPENHEVDDSVTAMKVELKLSSESPDKKKLNIFKRIPKMKKRKPDHYKNVTLEEKLMVEMGAGRLSFISEVHESGVLPSIKKSETLPSPIASPPPRSVISPELGTSHTTEVGIHVKKNDSRKRKWEKTKDKNEEFDNNCPIISKIRSESLEHEIIEKPKTLGVETVKKRKNHPTPSQMFPFFANFPPTPGLIPPQTSGLFSSMFNLDKHGVLVPQHTVPVPFCSEPNARQFPSVFKPTVLSSTAESSKPTAVSLDVPVTINPSQAETVEKTVNFKKKPEKETKKKKKHRKNKTKKKEGTMKNRDKRNKKKERAQEMNGRSREKVEKLSHYVTSTLPPFPVPPSQSSSFTPHPSDLTPSNDSLTFKKQLEESAQESRGYYIDSDGNQVWICPTCKGQDDGSPMIGCDGCNRWYHWLCVGIVAPPNSNKWFCRACIRKKRKEIAGEKKKKR